MAHQFRPRSTPKDNLRIIAHSIPWKLLLLLPVLIGLAVPAYIYAARAGNTVFPSVTNLFYKLSNAAPAQPSPTPLPPLPSVLPKVGSIAYTVNGGDSCDSILAYHMHMYSAGEVFSDVKPETVQALNQAIGQDCHRLQPGMQLLLSPQYPLVAFGGQLLKIEGATPQQVLPTPLINVSRKQEDYAPDCTSGCMLTMLIAPGVQVHLSVETPLALHVGSWVWTQAMLARKNVAGFDNYPYADPTASLNNMSLRACDFQVNSTHDDSSISCSQISPNTIKTDNGAWLLGVVGSNALDHWHYPIHAPTGTRVLLWLSEDNGSLKFQPGNLAYRYDDTTNMYVHL
ncbi:MAG: hypothetical protein NVS2B12_03880 [Ktedonobacteraceae bacterium]